MQKDRHTDRGRQTDGEVKNMTKIIFAFRNFANASENVDCT